MMKKKIKFKVIYFFKDLIHLNLDMVKKKVDDHFVFFKCKKLFEKTGKKTQEGFFLKQLF
jgi:hypothetical protein